MDDKLHGDLTVEHDVKVTGLVAGDLVVAGSAWLDLYGTVTGDLIVQREASAQVFGTVTGDVRVQGFASIDGTVDGVVRREVGGELFIGAEASIQGVVEEAT